MRGDADAELLARGDADSFAEFYRRHARRLVSEFFGSRDGAASRG
jgi:hypothetical protein